MKLPQTNPRDDPSALWALQMELMSIAESVLGRRDLSKKVYQPQFNDDVPHLRNTPNEDGAFVELSRSAECDWPTVVFEMAHETVHLLNPIPGDANYLEEGVAVVFSLSVQPVYGISMPVSMQSYQYALQLVSTLPGGPLEVGRRVRDRVGGLDVATEQDLTELFPGADRVILSKLAERFVRDADHA